MATAILHPSPFQEEIEAFTREEKRDAAARHGILFYGSSSIRLWSSLARDFPGLPVINRGFGGSTLADCVAEIDRLVVPLQPRCVVLYAGDNDLDQGMSPEGVLSRFEQFVGGVRQRLSWTPLLFVSIKPSPVRFWNARKIEQTNALIEQAIASRWREAQFLDLYGPMLDASGAPRRDLFGDDGLHLSGAGYRLWTAAVRKALAEMGFHGESRIS